VERHDSAGTAMLGLDGFVLLGVSTAFGELEQVIETTKAQAWCQGCGVAATAHGRRRTTVRDLPSAGRPVTLVWLKRLWRCAEPACAVRTWSETSPHLRPRSSLTERARREACRLVGEDQQDVASVAVMLGVSWATVMRAVREYGLPLVEDPARLEGVTAIGVDETAFLAANQFHHTEFITGIVALPGPGRPQAQLLDVMPGRTKAVVQQWITARPVPWQQQIHTCSLDPFRGYATALSTSLPHATRVLDAFHVVRLGLAAVDDVRRRVQQQTLGRRGHRDDPLYQGRRLLRRSFTTLNQRQWTRLENTLVLGDPTGQLTDAWIVAQELMLLYKRSHDLADARHRLWKILDRCARAGVPELLRLARTLDAWSTELLAAFTATGRCPASNGPTEAVNMLIKKIKRIGHGFRNLDNYRLRLLLAVGLDWRTVHWQAPPATPIRGRSPRLVA
jgi:transposase